MAEADWMDCESSSYSDSSSDDEERKQIVLTCVESMEKFKNYRFLGTLGRGTYGDVLHIYDAAKKSHKAAKIIISKNVVDLERAIWPRLKHENILAVEELFVMPDKTLIFITTLMFKAMHDIVLDKKFRLFYQFNHNAVKKWLRETLVGIQYMHDNLYCHLDIKLDNILIGRDGKACVCDFSFLNYSMDPLHIDDVGLPQAYRPPESFKKESRKVMNGIAVDMWAYGILVVEAYSHQHILDNVDDCRSFLKDITPVLEAVLEQDTFYSLARHTYPKYPFTDNELWNVLDFVDQFLRLQPSRRQSAGLCLAHNFLNDAEKFYVKMSEIFAEIDMPPDLQIHDDDNEILKKLSDGGTDNEDKLRYHSPLPLKQKFKSYLKTPKNKSIQKIKPLKIGGRKKKAKNLTKRYYNKQFRKTVFKNTLIRDINGFYQKKSFRPASNYTVKEPDDKPQDDGLVPELPHDISPSIKYLPSVDVEEKKEKMMVNEHGDEPIISICKDEVDCHDVVCKILEEVVSDNTYKDDDKLSLHEVSLADPSDNEIVSTCILVHGDHEQVNLIDNGNAIKENMNKNNLISEENAPLVSKNYNVEGKIKEVQNRNERKESTLKLWFNRKWRQICGFLSNCLFACGKTDNENI